MRIKNVMTKDVATCRPEDSMSKAAQIMWDRDCGVVPVVDGQDGELVGILTDRDICMASHMRQTPLETMKVREAMQDNPYACRPTQTVGAAHTAMRKHQIRRLPVLDKGRRLIGIVSLNDLARSVSLRKGHARTKEAAEVAKTLEAVSAHREPPAEQD